MTNIKTRLSSTTIGRRPILSVALLILILNFAVYIHSQFYLPKSRARQKLKSVLQEGFVPVAILGFRDGNGIRNESDVLFFATVALVQKYELDCCVPLRVPELGRIADEWDVKEKFGKLVESGKGSLFVLTAELDRRVFEVRFLLYELSRKDGSTQVGKYSFSGVNYVTFLKRGSFPEQLGREIASVLQKACSARRTFDSSEGIWGQ